ncbi:unnamed protein product [Candidula unifasciata]|uniref:Vitellogenin domain-containing protein n=1 Tax=Candidula unifasciata TaxID=100452 RepID=A0A8S4A3X9_9EUPU|nr:unnamed protein product [Candidula unifasciata]
MKTTCLVSLALLAVANAVPASVNRQDSYDNGFDSCAVTCKGEGKKFSYTPATTYIYDYTVDTETSMAGASEESAKLSIQARAEIQSLDGCDFALLLKDVRVSHTDAYTSGLRPADREEEVQRALEGSNLHFSFDDGLISSICPESEESTWALNFKRGLLTAFQNSMENLDKDHKVSEVDVSGKCEAEFTVAPTVWGWKKETKVTKTKNLLACSQRDGYQSMYQTVPYTIASEIQSLPILKGTHKCDYVIGASKILESASCEETHLYVPFSNSESGGKTRVQQKLLLKSQRQGVDAVIGPVKLRYDLIFDHDDIKDQLHNGPEALEQKLKEICDQTHDDIRPETPRLFSELVQIIKILNKPDLERAHKLVKNKMICPKNGRTLKFFLDALPAAETAGAVSLMTTLVTGQQVEGALAKAWLASLPLIQGPTSSMIEDGLKLLQDPSSTDALLPVTALVNRYCQRVSSCDSDYYVSQILSLLTSRIPDYCSIDDKNLKSVLVTLRAMGNLGHSALTSSIDKCLSSTSAPLDIKVAAADAYRRVPCDTSLNQRDGVLWTVLQDTTQDQS